jgi:microcystin degradation protein MlrC
MTGSPGVHNSQAHSTGDLTLRLLQPFVHADTRLCGAQVFVHVGTDFCSQAVATVANQSSNDIYKLYETFCRQSIT